MDSYKRVDISYSGYDLMNFPAEAEARIHEIAEKAESDGEWEYARDVRIDLTDEYFWSYWLKKTLKPITKPLLGHGELEEVFSVYRHTRFELNGGVCGEPLALCSAGDLICTKGLDDSKDVLYEDVASFLFDADIRFANLESTFSDTDVVPTKFCGDDAPKINLTLGQYKTLTEYKGKRYDIVQLANNHIVDCGEGGILKTLAQLKKDGITQVGVNPTEDFSSRTTITEKAGLKIGWVSHTMSVNFRPLPSGKPWLINITPFHIEDDPDLSRILKQIEYCRNEMCELIVVTLHWGLEFEFYPHPEQRKWAQAFADAGADIIIGQHPHVIQFSEIMHPKYDLSKDVPVIYSQGNLTPVFSSPAAVLSMLVRFIICKTNNSAKVTGMVLLPAAVVERRTLAGTLLELKKLKTLVAMRPELDDAMRKYVDQTAEYADMVLGNSWRE
jgi:poly-gamma-glutamate synthesis protein (capsule biosynthesis protein)